MFCFHLVLSHSPILEFLNPSVLKVSLLMWIKWWGDEVEDALGWCPVRSCPMAMKWLHHACMLEPLHEPYRRGVSIPFWGCIPANWGKCSAWRVWKMSLLSLLCSSLPSAVDVSSFSSFAMNQSFREFKKSREECLWSLSFKIFLWLRHMVLTGSLGIMSPQTPASNRTIGFWSDTSFFMSLTTEGTLGDLSLESSATFSTFCAQPSVHT